MAEHRYDPHEIEPRWQRVWARRAHVGGRQRRRRAARATTLLRARDAALPERRAAHRPPEGLLGRRRGRALPPPHRPPRAAPDGLRRVRAAGREPRDQDRPAPARLDRRRRSREFQQQFREWGISIDWSREFGTHEPRYYRWTQWIFLQLFRARPGLPQGGRGQVVPRTTRPCSPTSRSIDGRCERCGAEVEVTQLEQWFFRITDYADRLLDDLDDDRVARARQDDAAQLDRPLGGRRGHRSAARSSASTTRSSRRAPTRCSARRSS